MAINPQIPLAAIGQQASVDLIGPFVKVAQLKRLQQDQQLNELRLMQASRDLEEDQAVRAVFQQHADAGTLGTPEGQQLLLRDIGRIAPEKFFALQSQQLKLQAGQQDVIKAQVDLRRSQLDAQSKQLDLAEEVNEHMLEEAAQATDQPSYDAALRRARTFLVQRHLPTFGIDRMPKVWSPTVVNDVISRSMETRQQIAQQRALIDIEVDKAQRIGAATLPQRVEQARQIEAATRPGRLEVAERRGASAAERTAQSQERAAQIQAEAMVRAAEIERSEKPLTGAAAAKVSELNTVLEMATDVATLFDPSFVGQLAGRLGGVRQFTGQISNEEVELRRVVSDIKDTLLRARSGAQINEREFARLSKLVPDVTDQPNVFMAKLRGFVRSTRQLRDQKLKVATTGRQRLQEGTPEPDDSGLPSDPLGIR